MWAAGDGRYMSCYIYTAGGDRSLKLTGANLNFARCHSERSRRMNRSIDSGGGSSCKSLFATVDISTPLNVTAAGLRVTSERERSLVKPHAACLILSPVSELIADN